MARDNFFQFQDESDDRIEVEVYSNGQTVIRINNEEAVLLTNRAAHELRDMLNRRFPNAAAVQGSRNGILS